ncbi:MAG: hypothetical protein E6K65_01220 [Nitrospirae bacterium]|nr:MAG: hypothetical protein E6K65_01220 [Nitrospirota bacterium]
MRTLTAFPVLSPSDFLGSSAPYGFPVSQTSKVSYWYGARTAIRQGLVQIGIRPGDRVLVPAYACGSEVDTLLKCGCVLDYYRILPDMSPDLTHVVDLCSCPARAIFVINYFGFPQPMDTIMAVARAQGLLVIEDNAHGLFSADEQGRPLGSVGDLAVMSFTKALPLPDGGALVVNRSVEPQEVLVQRQRPHPLRVAGQMKSLIEFALARRYPTLVRSVKRLVLDPAIRVVKTIEGQAKASPAVAHAQAREWAFFEFKAERGSWTMSACSQYLLRRGLPHDVVVQRRRRNYLTVLGALQEGLRVRPLYRTFPAGCSPLFFPILAVELAGLRQYLTARGIESHRFGFFHESIPTKGFLFEESLKEQVLGLPLHQGLGDEDMVYLAGLLNDWNMNRVATAA